MPTTDVKILVPGNHLMVGLLGERDELLRLVEAAFPGTEIHVRGNEITASGTEAKHVGRLFEELVLLLERGQTIDTGNVGRTIDMIRADERPSEVLSAEVLRAAKGRTVRPKTSGQKRYVDAIRDNVITFGIGPAGTGKSWLAVAMAVQALQAKQVNRIILTRPAVEAGERLGFLPGDLMAKVDPYLRPLFDALFDMVEPDGAQRLLDRGTVEVAPLAFMRGRAQPVDQRVLTPWGWRAMGSLEVGDLVVGSDGLPTPVLGVFPQGRRNVHELRTQDGATTRCCAEHLWFVTTPGDEQHGKGGRVVRTDEMIGNLRRRHQRRYGLPVLSGPAQFPAQPVTMDPYDLGLRLGDRRDVEGVVIPAGGGGRPVTNPGTVAVRALRRAGTRPSATCVPPEYLFNTAEVRLGVLQGLLDAGGGPVVTAGRSCRISYSTCSARLRDDVVFLVRSLGGVAHVRARRGYVLDIRLPAGTRPFRLERNRSIYDATGGRRPLRMIDSIEPAGAAETVCIQVGAADSLYVTDDFLVTHNTLNGSFIILDEAQNATPEQMKMFLTRIGFGSKAVVTGDVTQIDVPTGRSGLQGLEPILGGIDGLSFVRLTNKDVVRHKIVQDIVDAYERHSSNDR